MMKIVSWNCQGSFRTKASQLRALKPDLAIIQECENPDKMAKTDALDGFKTIAWFGEAGKKGLAVLSPHPFTWEIDESYDPTFQFCVPLRLSGYRQLNLLAVWTKKHQQKQYSYIGQLHRAVIAYQSFLQEYPTMVIGDFNSNQQWDSGRAIGNHSAVVQLLQSAGLVSAYHTWYGLAHGKERTSTFHMNRQLKGLNIMNGRLNGYHIDYCFLPTSWMQYVKKVSIGSYWRWTNYSDHRPLSVMLDNKMS